ncbi:hypothetical protein ACJJTC_007208, partial [Scirpophaga incertulas]
MLLETVRQVLPAYVATGTRYRGSGMSDSDRRAGGGGGGGRGGRRGWGGRRRRGGRVVPQLHPAGGVRARPEPARVARAARRPVHRVPHHARQGGHALLAACARGQSLPASPELPADLFTACLTTPVKVAMRWFVLRQPPHHRPHLLDLIDRWVLTAHCSLLPHIRHTSHNCIQLAACARGQSLPASPELPADLFTACLTTPVKVAMRWFVLRQPPHHRPHLLDLIDRWVLTAHCSLLTAPTHPTHVTQLHPAGGVRARPEPARVARAARRPVHRVPHHARQGGHALVRAAPAAAPPAAPARPHRPVGAHCSLLTAPTHPTHVTQLHPAGGVRARPEPARVARAARRPVHRVPHHARQGGHALVRAAPAAAPPAAPARPHRPVGAHCSLLTAHCSDTSDTRHTTASSWRRARAARACPRRPSCPPTCSPRASPRPSRWPCAGSCCASRRTTGRTCSTSSTGGCSLLPHIRHTSHNCIQLAACARGQSLPASPELPADLFTACLTTPVKVAMRWFVLRQPPHHRPHLLDLIDRIPGQVTDRRTMLGELNWIFTAITDTIAWSSLPPDLFQQLFRADLLTASLCRNFLLADRIMSAITSATVLGRVMKRYQIIYKNYCFEMLQRKELPRLLLQQRPYAHSPFFRDQLTAFQVWLDM